jgi:hypothetical protein
MGKRRKSEMVKSISYLFVLCETKLNTFQKCQNYGWKPKAILSNEWNISKFLYLNFLKGPPDISNVMKRVY